jgi:hypothetical protein
MADATSLPSGSETTGGDEKRLQIIKPAEALGTSVPPVASKRRTASRTAAWRAWTGTIGDLRIINVRFEELVESRRNKLLHDLSEMVESRRNKILHDLRGLDESRRNEIADEFMRRDGLQKGLNLTPETTIQTLNGDKVSGPFEEVIDELDPRTWVTISMRARGGLIDEEYASSDKYLSEYGSLNEYLYVEFRRTAYDGNVVDLMVMSADAGMAASSLARLSELVELGKPRWAWLHRRWVPPLISVLSWIILVCCAAAIGRDWYAALAPDSPLSIAIPLAITLLLFGMVIPSWRLMRRLLPPAEIRYDHTQESRGTKFIASLIALWVIPIVVTVVLTLAL